MKVKERMRDGLAAFRSFDVSRIVFAPQAAGAAGFSPPLQFGHLERARFGNSAAKGLWGSSQVFNPGNLTSLGDAP
jgi:hypothetical protein